MPITCLVPPSHAATLQQIGRVDFDRERCDGDRDGTEVQPATLFERWKWDPKIQPYKSDDAILKAVSSGEKPIWRDDWMLAAIEDGDPRFGAYLRRAFEHGLAVTMVLRNRKMPRHLWCPEIYLLKLRETWRISALHALEETARTRGSSWTQANEANESLLLGYTKPQLSDWLDAFDWRGMKVGGGRTIYAVLDAAQRKTVMSVGKRCFGPADEAEGMTFHYQSRDDTTVLKRDAFKKLPAGMTLARASVHWKAIQPMFGPWKSMRGLVRATATKKTAELISSHLLTNVELLTRSGWK